VDYKLQQLNCIEEVLGVPDDLFNPIVSADLLNDNFLILKNMSASEPARLLMSRVFEHFKDIDGNFIEQFQTTGFDARTFELYLFAYLQEAGYTIIRDYDRPDFIVERNGIKVAIEATTVNPTQNASNLTKQNEISLEWIEKLRNELPIKFGSPLFSKLKKRYWELDHCKGIPIVLAIEAFHESGSLQYTSNSLIQYLYGVRHELDKSDEGNEYVNKSKIKEHRLGEKVIPSVFFEQPDTENISAIIFSNSGTTAKFKRMGYYYGCVSTFMKIIRKGVCYDFNPDALHPKQFVYDLDERWDESWGEGLEVFHNPKAKYPIPKDFFEDAAYHYIEDGEVVSFLPEFHPYYSTTYTTEFEDDSNEEIPIKISRVTRAAIDEIYSDRFVHPNYPEKLWFFNETKKSIGIIMMNNKDSSVNVIIYALEGDNYIIEDISSDFKDLKSAKKYLFNCI
jgi:hypothetical protein